MKKIAYTKQLICILICATTAISALATQTKQQQRTHLRIDNHWHFKLGEQPNAEQTDYSDNSWRMLNLPHDWSIESNYSPTNTPQNSWLPGGIGWYRRTLNIPEEWLSKKVLVRFDGIYMNSRVWLNGHEVGGRPYGFMTFSCDLTAFLQAGTNTLAVRVDNTPAPTARFYHGSGIYGHVDLLVLPLIHIVPHGGVFVRTAQLDDNRAELAVDTETRNDSPQDTQITLHQRIMNSYSLIAWGIPHSPMKKWQIGWNVNMCKEKGVKGAIRTEFGKGYVIGTTDLRDGRWHHIVSLFIGGDQVNVGSHVRHYVDGRLEGISDSRQQKIKTDVQTPGSRKVRIGKRLEDGSDIFGSFVGMIDELYVQIS